MRLRFQAIGPRREQDCQTIAVFETDRAVRRLQRATFVQDEGVLTTKLPAIGQSVFSEMQPHNDGVKILGKGDLTKALTVHAHRFSAKASERITGLGGKVEVLDWLFS